MRTFNAAAVLRSDVTTIKGYFGHVNLSRETGEQIGNDQNSQLYTWLCHRDLAATLQAGDAVLIEANGEVKIIVVDSVDADIDIDLDAGFDYSFAFQRVDTSEYTNRIQETRNMAGTLNSQRTNQLRENLAHQFGISVNEFRAIGNNTATAGNDSKGKS